MFEVELVAEHPVRELASLSETAEEEGYGAVWVTDHYNNRNPWVVLTAIALATDDIELGPGVTNPYIAHPAWIANAVASLDEVSGKRARLGIGAGDKNTLRTLELERESPLNDVLESVKLTRELLGGGSVTIEGLVNNARLNYDSREVPVYIGAQGPNMLRMAADHGDGILINASHPTDFEWSFQQFDPDTDAEVLAYTSFSISRERDAALEAAKQPVAFIAAGSPPQVLKRHGLNLELAEEIGKYIEESRFSEAFDLVTEDMLDAFSIYGTPEECAERVEELFEVGVDTVVVGSPLGPKPTEAIRIAADELM